MLNDSELMNIHVRALFTHDANLRLLAVNEPGGTNSPAPRLFLGRTRAGSVWRFRAGLPEELCKQLGALCAIEPPLAAAKLNQPPRQLETFVRLLEEHAPVHSVSSGPAYYFAENVAPSKPLLAVTKKNAEILQNGFDDFADELTDWQPFVAVVKKNRAVSICRSVRITPEAHEAGVETLPSFRGKGYAPDVALEWARLVQTAGAIPLYSTAWENHASQAVARKLKLKFYGADFQIH